MKQHIKRVGLVEAVGRNLLILSPDHSPGNDDEHASGVVTHEVGSKTVSIQSNLPREGPLHLTTPEAIRHTRDALTEVLKRMGVD
jgi:hypothetical protein